jgi:hypothetical protein
VPDGRLDRALSRLPGRRGPAADTPPGDLHSIVRRLDSLEAMVEGLQDAVDRQARRQDERAAELTRRLEPSELARSLSDDARRRGL